MKKPKNANKYITYEDAIQFLNNTIELIKKLEKPDELIKLSLTIDFRTKEELGYKDNGRN